MIHNTNFAIDSYEFSKNKIDRIKENVYANDSWPLVYILSDKKTRKAYIGETSDAIQRMATHLNSEKKKKLTVVQLITSNKFNKSATLDIESRLIKYLYADGFFDLLNGNLGRGQHNYYQKEHIYNGLFNEIWEELYKRGICTKSIIEIDNSDIFKYSPYKNLTSTQFESVNLLLDSMVDTTSAVVIEGGAGTGKTVIATYLFKLIHSDLEIYDEVELDAKGKQLLKKVRAVRKKYPKPQMALVVPMSSFRSTLKKYLKMLMA